MSVEKDCHSSCAVQNVMVKRRADEADLDANHEAKRIRPAVRDHLSHLSDELLLRVLSCLPVSQLAICQR